MGREKHCLHNQLSQCNEEMDELEQMSCSLVKELFKYTNTLHYFDTLKINIFGFYFKIHFDVSLPNPAYDIIFIYCCRMPLTRKGVSLSVSESERALVAPKREPQVMMMIDR